MSSAPIVTREGNQHVWVCPMTNNLERGSCEFEVPIADNNWEKKRQQTVRMALENLVSGSRVASTTAEGDEQYLVGSSTLRLLQGLMNVSYQDGKNLYFLDSMMVRFLVKG